jgi:hypothetical protein
LNAPKPDRRRRRAANRRLVSERRSSTDRRTGGGTVLRLEVDRRREGERRAPVDRRDASHTPVDQIRNAIDLLHAITPDRLPDEDRRLLDTALFRLRFALDRLTSH